MRRERVAVGFEVVDYEAGIGGEGYDPPKPRQQVPVRAIAIDPAVEQRHQDWVQAEGWKGTGQIAVAAASEVEPGQINE